MSSKRPTGKTPTSEIPRPSSTVPNDYEHLGVPGQDINITLNDTRRRSRRRQARRSRRRLPNWVKATIAIGTALFAFGIVMLVIAIIAFPQFFQRLEPRYQQSLINRAPAGPVRDYLESLVPTVPFEVLPTLGPGNEDAAQQLLMTQDATAAQNGDDSGGDLQTGDASPTPGSPDVTAPPTWTPTPTQDAGGIPAGALPTQSPTPLPVYETPTPIATPLPTWTPIYIPTQVPLPKQTKLSNIKYEQQGWNNCGPTTMTMALSYYGWYNDQYTAAKWMKPNDEDKNVSPWQMVRFVNENTGVKALYRYGGTIPALKRLLAAGFPVVVEESIQPAGDDWMGHYVLLMGYDDYEQHFLTFDSFLGSNQQQGRASPYSTFDERWRHFNRVFMVVYQPSQEMQLREALGGYVDTVYGYETALATARTEADRQRDDAWAWFNMGTAYVLLKQYNNGAIAFDQAFSLGRLPWRTLWYQFGPYEAYFQVGDYNNVRALANATLATTKYVEESYYWTGMAYAAEGNRSAAIDQFNLALYYNRNFFPAQEAKAAVENGTFMVAQTP
jgi:tetratricopeptide (TPR) repeat protein